MADERTDERTAGRVIDPDVDLHVDVQRREWRSRRWVLPAASIGGAIGAAARFLVEKAMPPTVTGWPAATFVVNVSGCFLLGALMAVLTPTRRSGSLWRVFAGVGVLGGYTTFSTYAVEAAGQVNDGEPLVAATYLVGTALAAGTAVLLGMLAGRTAIRALGESSR